MHRHSGRRGGFRLLSIAMLLTACGGDDAEHASTGDASALSHEALPGADARVFDLGHLATGAMLTGALDAAGSAEFVLGEEEGSLLMVHAMTPASDARVDLAVYRMDTGERVTDAAPDPAHFEARLPSTTAYKIEVSADQATDYAVEVEVPRQLFLGGDVVETVAWLPPWAPVTYLIDRTAGQTLEARLVQAPAGAHLTLHVASDGTPVAGSGEARTTLDVPLSAGAYLLRLHGGDVGGEFTLQATLR